MVKVFFPDPSYIDPPDTYRVLLVSSVFTHDRHDNWTAGQWLDELLLRDKKAKHTIEILENCGVDYSVVIQYATFYEGYHQISQKIIEVFAYLLLNDTGLIIHKINCGG